MLDPCLLDNPVIIVIKEINLNNANIISESFVHKKLEITFTKTLKTWSIMLTLEGNTSYSVPSVF